MSPVMLLPTLLMLLLFGTRVTKLTTTTLRASTGGRPHTRSSSEKKDYSSHVYPLIYTPQLQVVVHCFADTAVGPAVANSACVLCCPMIQGGSTGGSNVTGCMHEGGLTVLLTFVLKAGSHVMFLPLQEGQPALLY
jgi:hypothetical protein